MEGFNQHFEDNSGLLDAASRFEEMIKAGETFYYEVETLEDLLDFYMGQCEYHLAHKVVDIAKLQYPYNKQFSIREAELLSLADRPTEALDLLQSVEQIESYNPDFYLCKASILSQIGSYQKAIQYLHRALEHTDEGLDAIYFTLAVEHQNLEQYHQSINFLMKALELNPENEDALYELAYCFEVTAMHAEGVKMLTKILDEHPYNAHAWYNLGVCQQACGEYEKAVVAFDYSIVIDETFSAAYFNKANVLTKLGQYTEAIEQYKKALPFEILDSLIYFYIGDCYENLEHYKKALLYYEKALRKDPEMGEAWMGASNALDMLGRDYEAIQYIAKAIALDDENPDYWYIQAEFLNKSEFREEAISSFERAIMLGYDEPDLFADYASLYMMGDGGAVMSEDERQRVWELLDSALDRFPFDEHLLLRKSVMLYQEGNNEEGFEILIELSLHDPNFLLEFLSFFPNERHFIEVQSLLDSMNK